MRSAFYLWIVTVGCLRSDAVQCADGRICPHGRICDDVHVACIEREQLVACEQRGDGESCTIVELDDGICDAGVCRIAVCGDGYRRGAEQCDGLELTPDDTCEQFGYYYPGQLRCNAACSYDLVASCTGECGDGIVDTPQELCDGAAPPRSCTDLSYGAGHLECLGCGPDVADCKVFNWRREIQPLRFDDVHGTDSAVHAIGQGVLRRFDGLEWYDVDLSACGLPSGVVFYAVWTTSNGDAFVAASQSIVVEVTATACKKHIVDTTTALNLDDVWASGPTDIYAVDTAGGIFRFAGSSWSKVQSTGRAHVWGSGPNDVWAAGPDNQVLHFNGASWSSLEAVADLTAINALWGSSATEVYVGGLGTGGPAVARYAVSWSAMRAPPAIVTAGAIAAGRLFVAGDGGYVAVYSGGNAGVWTRIEPVTAALSAVAMAGTSSGHVYILPNNSVTLNVFEGNRLFDAADVDLSTAATGTVIVARHPGEVHAITSGGGASYVHSFDGTQWSTDGTLTDAYDLFLDANGTAFLLTSQNVRKRVGSSWNALAGSPPLGAQIWGVAENDFWVARFEPPDMVLEHWNGASVTQTYTASTYLRDLWGTSSDNVFAVGENGTILHFNGTSWSPMTSGTTAPLGAIHGTGSDVFAVGGNGTVLHYNGTAWASHDFPYHFGLAAVAARSADDVFVGGFGGVLYHYDGNHWYPVESNTDAYVQAMASTGDLTIWLDAAGVANTLLRTAPW